MELLLFDKSIKDDQRPHGHKASGTWVNEDASNTKRVEPSAWAVKGGSVPWVTLAMLVGKPYYLQGSLAASMLRSYITPGVHSLTPQMDAGRWAWERANACLRDALTVPSSEPDHEYLRSWVDRVGACNLSDLVCDDALLDSPPTERSSPALTLHPFTPLIAPPLTSRTSSLRLSYNRWSAMLRRSTLHKSY
eukprot:6209729-Pleurochrysis_carterae.AAC.1